MNPGNSMEREKQKSRKAGAGKPRLRLDDDDDSLTEVGEKHEFELWDELDSDDRRRDPLRTPRQDRIGRR